eukprot:TRINITY_DN7712_c0_g3_i1.p1 TRINITY_DN7712_c0_g3~~TRINITY_DN7712_c0_g3_i1.p1  ORF type:complete len:700 (+),score=104.46 TRINITY_DN7712_c0_g3_i1:157-2100(+)
MAGIVAEPSEEMTGVQSESKTEIMRHLQLFEEDEDGTSELNAQNGWSRPRRAVYSVTFNSAFTSTISCLIVVNLATMCLEVEDSAGAFVQGREVNPIFAHLDLGFQIVYSVEILLQLLALHQAFFHDKFRLLDLSIVLISWVDIGISQYDVKLPNAQLLKILRVARLSRAVRIMMRFPELYNMIKGFVSAMMAMLWGFVMIVMLLLVFAILSVELLHDKQSNIPYQDGTWCAEAFTSVFQVFLMLFQNLVAGDSWGQCALPVILTYPYMFFVFSGALVCVQLGFTNLILSSIVESASISRQEDAQTKLKRKKKEEAAALVKLYEVIRSIDVDGTGEITVDQFLEGYDSHSDIRFILAMLSIDRADVSQLFRLMDNDQSGTVSYDEFMSCIQKAETQDMRVQMMVLKIQICDIARAVKDEMSMLVDLINEKWGSEMALKASAGTRVTMAGGSQRKSKRLARANSGGDNTCVCSEDTVGARGNTPCLRNCGAHTVGDCALPQNVETSCQRLVGPSTALRLTLAERTARNTLADSDASEHRVTFDVAEHILDEHMIKLAASAGSAGFEKGVPCPKRLTPLKIPGPFAFPDLPSIESPSPRSPSCVLHKESAGTSELPLRKYKESEEGVDGVKWMPGSGVLVVGRRRRVSR